MKFSKGHCNTFLLLIGVLQTFVWQNTFVLGDFNSSLADSNNDNNNNNDRNNNNNNGNNNNNDNNNNDNSSNNNNNDNDKITYNCSSMSPDNDNSAPPPTDYGRYKINYRKDGSGYTVTLESKNGDNKFKGFFIQARSMDQDTLKTPVGSWTGSSVRTVDCKNQTASAAMNSNSEEKKFVELTWSPPEKKYEKVVFIATIMDTNGNFSIGTQSDTLRLSSWSFLPVSNSSGNNNSSVRRFDSHPLGSAKSSKMVHHSNSTSSGAKISAGFCFKLLIAMIAYQIML